MSTEARDDTRTAIVAAAVVGVIFSLAGLALVGSRAGWSVAVGATLGVANLVAMRLIIRAVLPDPEEAAASNEDVAAQETTQATDDDGERTDDDEASDPSRKKRFAGAWGAFAIVKMFLLFGGIWLLLTRHLVDPIALVIGYGVLPVGIVLSTLLSNLRVATRRDRGRRKR